MKALLLTATLAVMATPAHATYLFYPCYNSVAMIYCNREVIDMPNGGYMVLDQGAPGTITVSEPYTITDNIGDISTFDITWSAVSTVVTITKLMDDPTAIPLWIDAVSSAVDLAIASQGPASRLVYSGINGMVSGILSNAATEVGTGQVPPGMTLPIGPDPTATVDVWLMNTELQWTFDYTGTLNDPTGASNLRDFSALGITPVPGPTIGAGVSGLVVGLLVMIWFGFPSRNSSPLVR